MTQNAAIEEGLKNGQDKSMAAMKKRAAEKVDEVVTTAQDTAAEATEMAGEELRKLRETSTTFVRENPGAAIAGAVGVGILLGLALRGRD